jgi:hypothetical protein
MKKNTGRKYSKEKQDKNENEGGTEETLKYIEKVD